MARNLYIFEIDGSGNFSKSVVEDVLVTRDKPRKIVRKRERDYNLRMGHYKSYDDLNKITGKFYLNTYSLSEVLTFPLKLKGSYMYLTFEDELPREVEKELLRLYNEQVQKIFNMYQAEMDKLTLE